MSTFRKVINASGKMSILGTSVVSDNVAEAIKEGAQNFYVMSEFMLQVEDLIAKHFAFESSKIVASAAAGIVTSTAADIGRDDHTYFLNPFTHKSSRREIIIPKGHNINFGAPIETMIELGGGIIVEAGYSNQCSIIEIQQKVNENTTGILYIKSHHSVQKIC